MTYQMTLEISLYIRSNSSLVMLSVAGWLLGRKKKRSLLFNSVYSPPRGNTLTKEIPRLKWFTISQLPLQFQLPALSHLCAPSVSSRSSPIHLPTIVSHYKNKCTAYCAFRLSTRLRNNSFVFNTHYPGFPSAYKNCIPIQRR